MTKEELYAVADQPIPFRLGKYMREGFDVYKKFAGGFIGLLLLSFIIYIGLAIIPFVGILLLPFVILLIHAGVLMTIRKLKNNEHVVFNDFFAAFKNPGPVIVLGIVLFLFLLLSMAPIIVIYVKIMMAVFSGNTSQGLQELQMLVESKGMLYLYYIPPTIVSVLYVFSFHVLLFVNDNFWIAMEASRKVAFKKFFHILGTFILLNIIVVLGAVFTFGLGLFVLIPWMHATISMAFEDIYKPTDNTFDNKIDTFGAFQKDINTEADEKKYKL